MLARHAHVVGAAVARLRRARSGRKVAIRATYQPSGRIYTAGCRKATLASWIAGVRAVIATLS